MKPFGFERIGLFAALLGLALPAFTMQEQHPGQHQERGQQGRSGQEHGQQGRQQGRPGQERQQPQHQERAQHPAQPQHEGRPQQHGDRPGQPGHEGGRQAWEGHRAHDFHAEHRDWEQRGGYHGYRVPEDRFRRSFGEEHGFRMSGYRMGMWGGRPGFRYGGYRMSFLEPFPEYWGPRWYAEDDVYIGFSGGGYYMYNRSFPGDRIALSISF